MSNLLKALITVFIIGLVVMAIVFFSIFGIMPVEKLTKVLKSDTATSTGEKIIIVSTTTIVERIIEKEVPVEEEKPEVTEPKPKPPPKFEDKYKHPIRIAQGEFSPSTVTVSEGEDVVIGLKSDDKEYTIKIPGYGLSQTVAKGEEKIMAFQALTPGEFEIVCEGCREGFNPKLIVE